MIRHVDPADDRGREDRHPHRDQLGLPRPGPRRHVADHDVFDGDRFGDRAFERADAQSSDPVLDEDPAERAALPGDGLHRDARPPAGAVGDTAKHRVLDDQR